MNLDSIKNVIEAALMVADEPLDIEQLLELWSGEADAPSRDGLEQALSALSEEYENRGIELKLVASGYRIQARAALAPILNRLFERRSPRYSRALLETLAVIAYRQPVTRAEIEAIRGVAVSSNIIRTLTEREWVRVAGHRDIPGRPAVYATTREFLDYFNLRTLSDLPELAELRDINGINADLFAAPPVPAQEHAEPPEITTLVAAAR
jgi:segregation and condensation protein B